MVEGWVSIHRQIMDHWIYQEKRVFSRFEAWVDIILRANHADNKFMFGGELIEVKRGQLLTSIRKLCDHWKWSNTKVTQFLKMLEDDGMLVQKSDTKKTLLTVVNYDKFQSYTHEKTTVKRHENDTETTLKHTNNNVNNDNNDNKKKKENIYTPEFEQFWSVYPRKVAKAVAFGKFKAALKKDSFEYIMQCAMNYAKDCEYKGTEQQYIKHPSTFLEKERYRDYFMIVIGGGNGAKYEGRAEGVRYGQASGPNRKPSISDAEMDDLFAASRMYEVQ